MPDVSAASSARSGSAVQSVRPIAEGAWPPFMETSNYCSIVATFRRPAALAISLGALLTQTKPPSLVVVADNDPLSSAEPVVAAFADNAVTRVHYLPIGANLGPAGGWARAAAWAQIQPERGGWLHLSDDDDPLENPAIMAAMLAETDGLTSDVAAIGLMGAVFNRRWAVLHRARAERGSSTDCDYLGSNGVPLYRWDVIDRYGFFDEALFFGFEDLDYGLRLRAADLHLRVVAPAVSHTVQPSAPSRVPWREYFKTRALVTVCRRHVGAWAVLVTIIRSSAGALVIAAKHRDCALAVARWRGAIDGLRGRLSRQRYVPSENPAKPA